MTTITIRFKLNDEDPQDRAILEVLQTCTPGRMSSRIRDLLAIALGLKPSANIAKSERLASRALPSADDPKPAPIDGKSSFQAARDNFLNSFG